MQHLAIMKKAWNLIPLILNKEKKIESRWYKTRRAPWNLVKKDEIIYFKNSGEPVTAKAEVEKVIQFFNLNDKKIREILELYGKLIAIKNKDIPKQLKDKKYCILIYLKNPQKIKPFEINKKGYGSASAWLSLNNINDIKTPQQVL